MAEQILTDIELVGRGRLHEENVKILNDILATVGGGGEVDLSEYAKTVDVATKEQGEKADTAIQPAGLADYAKTADVATKAQGDKADSAVQPAGLNGYAKTADVATKAQGEKADSAVQPTDLNGYAKTADVATKAQGTKADGAIQKTSITVTDLEPTATLEEVVAAFNSLLTQLKS